MTVLATPLPTVGAGLNRPESVIALADGRLYACDRERGVTRADIAVADQPKVAWPVEQFVPNGIALQGDGTFLIANVGPKGGVWRLTGPGKVEPYLGEANGVPVSPLNFVFPDAQGRCWLSLSTRKNPRDLAFRKDNADGAIGLVRGTGRMEIVATGLGFTNELRIDPTGRWLYVNETIARRLSRFEVGPGGKLGPRVTVCEFGPGIWPDGLEFDAEGGVWLTSVVSNRVVHVDAGGHYTVHLEDTPDEVIGRCEQAFQECRFGWDEISAGKDYSVGNISSIAFGGPDLRTAYLGSLFLDRISVWRAPVAGAEPHHWRYSGPTVLE